MDELPDFRSTYAMEYQTCGMHTEFYNFLNAATGRSIRVPQAFGVILCYWTLLSKVRELREREANPESEDALPKHVRRLCDPGEGQVSYAAAKDVSPLPAAIVGRCFNKLSHAIVPLLCAEDECGMAMVLTPSTGRVRDMLLRLYGIPEHDALYPESSMVAGILVPEGTEFPLLMVDTRDYIYSGLVNLADFFPDDFAGDRGSQDYVFHAFYVR